MVIALMVGWVLTGLLLALFVGGAVRVAEQRGDWTMPGELHDAQPAPTS